MLTVLDIGARGGPDPRWFPFAQSVKVVGVEADGDECARLNQSRFPVAVQYLEAALGRADGTEGVLHLTRQRGCSSLLEPNHEFLSQFPYGEAFAVERTVPLQLVSLDSLCARHGVTPDVIKIDTQGYELEILRGGERAVASAFLIELEVEFNPLYKQQPLFGDLDAHLRSRGFALLGLRRTAWRRSYDGPSALGGTTVHGDALYYRTQLPQSEDLRRRLAVALTAYRQLDFVRSLGLEAAAPTVPFLQGLAGRVASRLRPHRHLRAWLDQGRPGGAKDWHDPDFF
jgi:FkbM family methyltransferase